MFNIIIATMKKNRIEIKRAIPVTFILGSVISGASAVVFPYCIYEYFFSKNISSDFTNYVNSSDYLTYIVLGSAMNILAISTLMNVGRALITELRTGTLEMLLITPSPRLGYFIGTLLEQMGRSIFEFLIVLSLGTFLGANLWRILSIQFVVVILLSIFSFFSMSLILSSVMLYTRDTYISQNTLFFIMAIVCGVSYPIEYLPSAVQYISKIFPMTYSLKLLRDVVMSNGNIADNFMLIFNIIFLSCIYLMLGCYLGSKIEKKIISNIFG